MLNIAILMPVIGAIGFVIIFVIIFAIILIIRSMEKREKVRSANMAKFYSFAEEIMQGNAEIRKELQIVKEKTESIDKMMKDI